MMPSLTGFMAWVEKYTAFLVIGAVTLAIIGLLIWRHHEQVLVNAAAPAKAQAQVNAADAQSGRDAVNAVSGNGKKEAATDDTTRKNNVIILKTPGAEVSLSPALDAAGRVAVCLRESASGLPECQRLLHPNP